MGGWRTWGSNIKTPKKLHKQNYKKEEEKTTQKNTSAHKPPNTASCCFAEEGQREGGAFDILLHPQISGCYCAAAGCHIW